MRQILASCAVATALSAILAAPWAAAPAAAQEPAQEQKVYRSHAIAMHGEPKYPADFQHFDYVNPDAPKGGAIHTAAEGTFDSFNPWISKGRAVSPGGDTLLIGSFDEAFTEYCLICETLEWPEDRSWVIFHLRPEARWHDGEPVTPEDVIFSLQMLKEKGQPFYRFYYGSIERAEKVGQRSVKFTFAEKENRELPLIAGQLPILPKHYWEDRDFESTTLEPPLTSGPYRIVEWEPGRFVVRERVEDYWARDLPVNRGQDNFHRIRTSFFRDATVIRQALKSGALDYHQETQAKAWALDYDIPAVRKGWLKKVAFPHQRPTGMQAFIFNTRRTLFKDPKVREALSYAFDFEWTNPTLFFGQYTRNNSYFENSELASRGLPEGRELEILSPYRGKLPEEVFTEVFSVPVTDGSGWPRENLVKALKLLGEAGWKVDDEGVLRNVDSGRPFAFEFLLVSTDFQRIVLPMARNLRRIGIDMKVRLVDSSQYINRYRSKDFDMISRGWGQSDSPGNEQRDFWSSTAAESPGSRNLAGITDPVIDELIELVIQAPSREELIYRTRALDRALLWGFYVIPAWHLQSDRILYWDKFDYPPEPPKNGTSTAFWWYDEAKAQALATALPGGGTSIDDDGQQTADFDARKLLGLSFFLVLIAATWFAIKVSGRRRKEATAVIES
ncbi:extracellular solute-binding protein [Pelagibius sp. CAU 1746]|uniref:extracellular solute-binding protein n=1 Tax=Pelagibius sp. CAU 1746 TaxID=3140370 RepID=UPI00325B1FBC